MLLACVFTVVMQAARNALRSEEVLIQMSDDWAAIDIEAIIAQTLYAIQPLDVPQQYMNMVPQCKFIDVTTLYLTITELTTLTDCLLQFWMVFLVYSPRRSHQWRTLQCGWMTSLTSVSKRYYTLS